MASSSPIFGESMYGNAKHVRLQSNGAPPKPPVCSLPAVAPKAQALVSTLADLGDFSFETATLASLEAAIAAEAAAVERLVDEESERKRMRHGSPGSVNPRQPTSTSGSRPAGGAAEAPGAASWPCSACTFMNAPASPTCSVCSAPRAGGTAAAAVAKGAGAGASASTSAEWTCGSCTADNVPSRTSCYMCGTARAGGQGGRGASGV